MDLVNYDSLTQYYITFSSTYFYDIPLIISWIYHDSWSAIYISINIFNMDVFQVKNVEVIFQLDEWGTCLRARSIQWIGKTL